MREHKNKIHRAVVNEKDVKCFACKRPGHKVAGCHDKKAKAAWISEREAKNQSKRDYDSEDNREGRKKHRDRNERSDSRRNSSDRDNNRSRSNDRSEKKKKKQSHPRSRDSWMNFDGEDLDQSDGSTESYMVRYEVWKGDKLAVAFNVQFKDMRDWVCIDSGTNKLILMNNSGWNNYIRVIDEFLKLHLKVDSLRLRPGEVLEYVVTHYIVQMLQQI